MDIRVLWAYCFAKAFKLLGDKRGGIGAKTVVALAVGLFLFAIMFPVAMDEITGANTTAWETPVTTIFQTVLPGLQVV